MFQKKNNLKTFRKKFKDLEEKSKNQKLKKKNQFENVLIFD